MSEMSEKIPISNIIGKMKVHSGLRVKIPAELCKEWGLRDGDYVIFFYSSDGNVCLTKIGPRGSFRVVR